jgi:hypothetical protein
MKMIKTVSGISLLLAIFCVSADLMAAKVRVINNLSAADANAAKVMTGVKLYLTDGNSRSIVLAAGADGTTDAFLAGFTGIDYIDEKGNLRSATLNIPGVSVGWNELKLVPGGRIALTGGTLVPNATLDAAITASRGGTTTVTTYTTSQ